MKKDEQNGYSYRECESVLSKHKIHAERKRVFVAFADLLGFAPWIRRGHSLDDFQVLISLLYQKIIHFRDDKGYFVKLLGDGAMLVKEMSAGHNCNKAIDFLKDMNCFTKFIVQSIDKTAWPRPDGFRVRVAAGHVLKMNMRLCKHGFTFQSDYVGYPVNLASRMLDIAKDSERLICHESVRDIIGVKKAEKAGVTFKPLHGSISTPEGVDDEDMKGLWSFEFQ